MLADGFFKVYRSLIDHPIYQQCPDSVLRVWLACLAKANWKPSKWYDGHQQIELRAGAFVFGQESFAKLCRVSRQQLRTALEHLKNMRCITMVTTSQYSLLVVENWDTYQSMDVQPTQVDNQRITNGQPASNQRITTVEEVKKLRSEEYTQAIVRAIPPRASDLNGKTSQRWEEFWGKYPRKQRKDFAAGQFFSLVTVDTEAAMFACLERYLRSEEVSRNVVMNPDKWLLEQHQNGWLGDWPGKSKTLDELIEERYADDK